MLGSDDVFWWMCHPKISMGMKNTTPMTHNACELEKLKWEFYLKMYYLYRNHNK